MDRLVVAPGFLEFLLSPTCDGKNRSPGITLRELHCASPAVIVCNPFEKSWCSFTPRVPAAAI